MKVNTTLFIGLVVLMNACKPDYDAPCRDSVVKIINEFAPAELAVIPYGMNDSVVFVSTVGDTVLFETVSYQSNYTYLPTVVEGNPECPVDKDAYRRLAVDLYDSTANIGIRGYWEKETDTCTYVKSWLGFSIKISDIGLSTGHYTDSLILNQKVFYKVHTLYNGLGDSIIINSEFGVVYFVDRGKAYRLESFNKR